MFKAFDAINARYSIRARMRLLGGLMIVPVLITGYLLYQSHMDTVRFAQSEFAGTTYIAAAWPTFTAGAGGKAADEADLNATKTQATRNTAMLPTDDANALDGQSDTALMDKAGALIADVTDKSSLILDPDLDSYYMMDAVTTKLPATVLAARALKDAGPGNEMAKTRFEDAAAALADSMTKSGQYSKAKALNPATATALDGFSQAAKAFAANPDAAGFQAVLGAQTGLFTPGNTDLQGLLKARMNRAMLRTATDLGSAAAVLLLALFVGQVIASGLNARLTQLSKIMQRLTFGETVHDIPFGGDKHETGIIAGSLKAFADAIEETEEIKAAQEKANAETATARRDGVMAMAEKFESSLLGIVEQLNTTARSLGDTADALHTDADHTRTRTIDVAHSIDEASGNVQSVAGATEEMAASSKAIADQASHAAQAAQGAADKAQETHAKVSAMLEASNRIGSSIEMISQITSQTNLLALNATIEAARAGDAGRGFNVVATEVKALAQQTARATSEISEQVKSVQEATQEASTAMNAIADLVISLRDISNAISESVIQQTAAVAEISRSTLDVASSTARINETVAEVSETATRTGNGAQAAREETRRLFEQSQTLQATAIDFLKTVRAA
jgi:methyl-accepting chemotaxis protein